MFNMIHFVSRDQQQHVVEDQGHPVPERKGSDEEAGRGGQTKGSWL